MSAPSPISTVFAAIPPLQPGLLALAQLEILRLAEQAIDNLPENFRIVFVARVLEGMSVEETAALLALKPKTVKTRLHPARRLVREQLNKQVGPVLMDAFPFAGPRCARITSDVLERLGLLISRNLPGHSSFHGHGSTTSPPFQPR